jgi:ATP-dependent RNA helicase DDX23/PRP28
VGGASYEVQKGKLRKGAEIVVATPGRLLDCLQKRYAVLNQCAYIVLDEADRMIDLGFEPQVIEVLAAMPASNMKPLDAPEDDGTDNAPTDSQIQAGKLYRTTYMFSATMPIAVERIAKRYLRRPVTVVVGSTGRAVDTVTQRIEWMDRKQKPAALTRVLDNFQMELEHSTAIDNDGFKIICFVNNRVSPTALFCACLLPRYTHHTCAVGKC